VLIAKYFEPAEQISLYELVGIPIPSPLEIAQHLEAATRLKAERKGREARFRICVVSAYNYACALTGYRLTTIAAGSIVDAAHVHQFSDSQNNDPRNGIALCKNAHWLFDQGLWSLTDEYQIIVAVGKYTEESPEQKALFEYQGQRIRLPKERVLYPDPAYLAWHRKNRFQQL
jgi:putative restriction endonuclease